MKRRLITALLLTVFLLSCLAFSVVPAAGAATAPTLAVDTRSAWGGDTVTLTVSVSDNPGIGSAYLEIRYDERLTLDACENTGLWEGSYLASSQTTANPYYVSWDNAAGKANMTQNGTLLTLTFRVASGATGTLPVTVSYTDGNVIDTDFNEISVACQAGGVSTVAPQLKGLTLTAAGPELSWEAMDEAEYYKVYRKANGAAGWDVIAPNVTGTVYTDTAVNSGISYCYTVKAFKNDGAQATSYDTTGLSALWLAQPTLTGAVNAADGVTVTWQQVAGATGYHVYRQEGSGSWEWLKSSSSLSYTDPTAVTGTTYRYTVRAYQGTSLSSCNAAGLTLTRVATPQGATVTPGTTTLKATWKAVDGVAGYRVYNKAAEKWVDVTDTSYTFTGLKAGTAYAVYVRAYVKNGSTVVWGAWNTPVSGKTAPAIPTVTAANAATGITASWNKVTGATGYIVYRRQYSGGKWSGWTQLTKTAALTYADNTAKAGVDYQYTARAYHSTATGGYTASATVRRLTNPKVTAANAATGITASWGKVTGASGYIVYRRQYSGGKWSGWSQVAQTTALTYTDKAAKAGVDYQYTARAYYGSVKSAFTASATVRRLTNPKVTAANAATGITASWNKVTGASGYLVYRRQYSGGKWSGWTQVAKTTALTYADKTAKAGVSYQYTARAYYGSVKSAFTASATLKRLTQPTVKAVKASNGIKASWNKVTGATGYIVYRRQYSGGKWSGWTQVAKTTALSYTDKTAKKGVTYQYTVRAYSGSYQSSYAAGNSVKR